MQAPMNAISTRDQIVAAADELFYQNGFEFTSFADIAQAVQISRGNFYYHFKSKDEILAAVIQRRLEKTRAMLAQWQQQGATPADRIKHFIHILITNQAKILLYGCPLGTLTTELSKLGHAALPDASEVFTLFRDWLRTQFVELGHRKEADRLAMHVLARSQGVATLANAFNDETFLRQEVRLLCDWLDGYVKK